jgi:hypothetical protein
MNSTNLDNRKWFIAGLETATKIDRLIALIKGEK